MKDTEGVKIEGWGLGVWVRVRGQAVKPTSQPVPTAVSVCVSRTVWPSVASYCRTEPSSVTGRPTSAAAAVSVPRKMSL